MRLDPHFDPRPPFRWPLPRDERGPLRRAWDATPAASKPTGILLLSYAGLVILAIGLASSALAWWVILR